MLLKDVFERYSGEWSEEICESSILCRQDRSRLTYLTGVYIALFEDEEVLESEKIEILDEVKLCIEKEIGGRIDNDIHSKYCALISDSNSYSSAFNINNELEEKELLSSQDQLLLGLVRVIIANACAQKVDEVSFDPQEFG